MGGIFSLNRTSGIDELSASGTKTSKRRSASKKQFQEEVQATPNQPTTPSSTQIYPSTSQEASIVPVKKENVYELDKSPNDEKKRVNSVKFHNFKSGNGEEKGTEKEDDKDQQQVRVGEDKNIQERNDGRVSELPFDDNSKKDNMEATKESSSEALGSSNLAKTITSDFSEEVPSSNEMHLPQVQVDSLETTVEEKAIGDKKSEDVSNNVPENSQGLEVQNDPSSTNEIQNMEVPAAPSNSLEEIEKREEEEDFEGKQEETISTDEILTQITSKINDSIGGEISPDEKEGELVVQSNTGQCEKALNDICASACVNIDKASEEEEDTCDGHQLEDSLPISTDSKRNEAAVKIQSFFRGYKSRQNYKQLKKSASMENLSKPMKSKNNDFSAESSEDVRDVEKAAIKIQSAFRGYASRKRLHLLSSRSSQINFCNQSDLQFSRGGVQYDESVLADLPWIKDMEAANEAARKIQKYFRKCAKNKSTVINPT